MKGKRITLATAALALVLTPAFAQHQGHSHGQGMDKEKGMGKGHGEHCTPAWEALDTAIALLDQAKQAGDPGELRRLVDQARQQLGQVKEHHSTCMEKMGMHGEGLHKHGMAGGEAGEHAHGHDMAAKTMDPVCGMEVDPKTATHKSVYAGKTYFFCSAEDKAKFDKNPEEYLKKKP